MRCCPVERWSLCILCNQLWGSIIYVWSSSSCSLFLGGTISSSSVCISFICRIAICKMCWFLFSGNYQHSPSALGVAASFVRLDGRLFTLIQGQPVNQGSNFFQLFLQRFVHNVQWSRWCPVPLGGKNHQNQSVQKWGTRKNLKCGFYDMDC